MDRALVCREHLLGEHVGCHTFRGSIRKGLSLRGFLNSGLVDSRMLAHRHDELAAEMRSRGSRHQSPLPRDFDATSAPGDIDAAASAGELAARCEVYRQLPSTRRHTQRSTTTPGSPEAPGVGR